MWTLTFAVFSLLLVCGSLAFCNPSHRNNKAYPKRVTVESHPKYQSSSRMPARKDAKAPKGRFHDKLTSVHHGEKGKAFVDVHDDHYADIFGHVYSKDGKTKKSDTLEVVEVLHDDHLDEHFVEPCAAQSHLDEDHSDLFDDLYLIHEDIHDDYDVVHEVKTQQQTDPEDTDCCRCTCQRKQKHRKICWDDFDDDSMP